MGLLHVFLDHHLVRLFNRVPLPRQINSFTLARIFWFHDVCDSELTILGVFPEVVVVMRQHVGSWKEIVIRGDQLLHFHKVTSEHVFPRQIIDSWEVVGPLVVVHFLDEVDEVTWRWSIEPSKIPIAKLFLGQVKLCEGLTRFFDDLVVGMFAIHPDSHGLFATIRITRVGV